MVFPFYRYAGRDGGRGTAGIECDAGKDDGAAVTPDGERIGNGRGENTGAVLFYHPESGAGKAGGL